MSNYWDVYCKDCHEKCGIDNANREQDLMHELVRHRHAIASIAPLVNDTLLELRQHNGISVRIPVEWFAEHHEHELCPIDEYGTVADEVCENKNCGRRTELQHFALGRRSVLLCAVCRGAAGDLMDALLAKAMTERVK